MKFTVLPLAELEATEAAIWYDEHRAGLGSEFLDELERSLERIRSAPESLPLFECYRGPHEICRCLLNRFPYVVIFLRRPAEVVVLAVGHTRRRPLFWLGRLA